MTKRTSKVGYLRKNTETMIVFDFYYHKSHWAGFGHLVVVGSNIPHSMNKRERAVKSLSRSMTTMALSSTGIVDVAAMWAAPVIRTRHIGAISTC